MIGSMPGQEAHTTTVLIVPCAMTQDVMNVTHYPKEMNVGEMADMLTDGMWEMDDAEDMLNSAPLWNSRKGPMRLDQMTDSHLENAAKMLRDRCQGNEVLIRQMAQALLEEPLSLPDLAQSLLGMAGELEQAVKWIALMQVETNKRQSSPSKGALRRGIISGNVPPEESPDMP
jgi:hypothetical protein